MIKLSIITINYNNAEGLRKTLASVAAQTYPNIEHIIVDGGSTDGSVDVIREYESTLASSLSPLASRLKWLSEQDKGIYNAMNKGIEIALDKRVVNDALVFCFFIKFFVVRVEMLNKLVYNKMNLYIILFVGG